MNDNANYQLSNPPNVANNFMKAVDEHAELLSELCTVHVLWEWGTTVWNTGASGVEVSTIL